MKTAVMTWAFAALSIAAFAETGPGGEARPAQRRSNSEIMAQIAMKRYGGKIRQPNSEKGEVVFVNSQKTVDANVLEKAVKKLESQFRYVVRISEADVKGDDGHVVIRLEDLDREERIILAPENYWVSVNVKSLAADNPPRAILADRFEKEVRRAFAFVCGGTCGTEPGGLCRMATSLADLDAIPGHDFALDIEARIINNMQQTAVRPYRMAKYAEAVQEGWAPAPTNEYQKAIWEETRKLPEKPIQIKFDPKKGR